METPMSSLLGLRLSIIIVVVVVVVVRETETRVSLRERRRDAGPAVLRLPEGTQRGPIATAAAAAAAASSLLVERERRGAGSVGNSEKLVVNFTVLPDEAHNEAIVHWSGDASQVIFLLTRQRSINGSVVSSTLYISRDYGSSFDVKAFNSSVLLHYFYVCPNNKDKLVFVDLRNRNLHVTTDEGKTFEALATVADADRIVFHPKREDTFLSYSDAARTLHLTQDFGHTWILVHEMVNPHFYWAVLPSVDQDENLIHLEIEDPATGEFLYRAVTAPYPTDVTVDRHLGFIEVGSVVVQNEYIFVQKKTTFSSHLYVSYKRGPFMRTHFPRDVRPMDFEIVDTDDGQVLIAANHHAGAVTLYLSDATGRFYVKSLQNVMALNQPESFRVDLYEVKGLPGSYLANCVGTTTPETFITFNQGGKWQKIPSPSKYEDGKDTNCHLPGCSLYIHLHIDSFFYGISPPLTDDNAPGLILAHGIIGKDSKETKFVMSQDGGLTWTVVMNGTYRHSILDQGGAIIAVPINTVTQDTTEILYSCTEGNSWQRFVFDGQRMKVDGLLNEPGITTLIASLYGHRATKDETKAGWIIAKLNFSLILSNPCQSENYHCWYPYNGCQMGQRSCYERRLADVECFNGRYYVRAVNVTNCSCSADDYECDFGYELDGDHCEAASWLDPSVPVHDCEVGDVFLNSSGYRRVASSKCVGNEQHVPMNATCPFIKPNGLQIQVEGGEFQPRKTNVTFLLYQERGTREKTNYIIDFGDGSPVVRSVGFRNVEKIIHLFEKTGIMTVTVQASNAMGSLSASVRLSIQDCLIGLHLSVSHAPQMGMPVIFQVTPLFRFPVPTSTYHSVHYLWRFGTEKGDENGQLLWNSSVKYTYKEPGNYSVWVQGFSGVGSVYRTITLPVYGTVTTVQVTLSGIVFPLGSVSTAFEDVVAETLRRVLAFELGLGVNFLDVEFSQQMAPVAFVSFLPKQQMETTDEGVSSVISLLMNKVKAKEIVFTLPDEAFGSQNNITIVSASVLPSADVSSFPSNHFLGFAVGVPVLIAAVLCSIVVTVYFKRRLRSLRNYSMLNSRYHAGESLLDDTDDDDPLIDSPCGGTRAGDGGGGGVERGAGRDSQQRLTLSDDDDLLGTPMLLSSTNKHSTDSETTNRDAVNC